MFKKYLTLFITFVLIVTLTACGGGEVDKADDISEDMVKEDVEELAEGLEESSGVEEEAVIDIEVAGMLVDGKSVEKDYKGTGPAKIKTRLGSMLIPKGLDYKIYMVPYEGKSASMQVNFGVGNTNAGFIEMSTTRMIASLDDAANECIRMNDFNGSLDSEIGGEVTYGDKTFKEVTIKKSDGSRVDQFLAYYYKTENDDDGFLELEANEKGGAYNMDINDPLIGELLESLELR